MDPQIQAREQWLPLLYKIASKISISYPWHDRYDLIQSGYIGLDKSMQSWERQQDSGKPNKTTLQQYLQIGISNAITQHIRQDFLLRRKGEERKIAEIAKANFGVFSLSEKKLRNSKNWIEEEWDIEDHNAIPPDRIAEYNDYIRYINVLLDRMTTMLSRHYTCSSVSIREVIRLYICRTQVSEIVISTGLSRIKVKAIIDRFRRIAMRYPQFSEFGILKKVKI